MPSSSEIVRSRSTVRRTGVVRRSTGAWRIFLAQFISVSGDRLFSIALSWWVVAQSDVAQREFVLGLLLAVSTLPMALSGPFLGPLVDRYSKRGCMAVADVARLLLMGALAYLIHIDRLDVPVLFGMCILIFAFEPFFDSAVSASLSPLSRDSAMLSQFVALESAMPNLGAVMGALLGSVALALWSTEFAFWVNAATFLISLILVLGLPPLRAREAEAPGERPPRGYGFLKDHPAATRLMICFGLANFFAGPLFFYLPLLARDVLRTDGSGLAQLELAFAAGNLAVLAWFFIRPAEFRRVRWLRFVLVSTSGAFLFLLGRLETLPPMAAVLFLWGGSIAFVTYLAITCFQRTIPDECKGRFFAILTSICTVSLPLSFSCVGFLSTAFSLQELITANAVFILAASLAFLAVPDEVHPGSFPLTGNK